MIKIMMFFIANNFFQVLDKTDWAWKAPIAHAELTDEDKLYGRSYRWDDKYQADNTKGWVLEEIDIK